MSTTTQSRSDTVRAIKGDFKQYTFISGHDFSWLGSTKSITYGPLVGLETVYLLLHEIAHAELHHAAYDNDIELVRHEAEAWEFARATLAPRYGLIIDIDTIEDALDTYRLWLHHRSLCPTCAQTGMQQKENTYSCINCRCSWQVNEARTCDTRRKIT